MSLEHNILAIFDEDITETPAEYHMEEAYDDCLSTMSNGGGGGGGGGGRGGGGRGR